MSLSGLSCNGERLLDRSCMLSLPESWIRRIRAKPGESPDRYAGPVRISDWPRVYSSMTRRIDISLVILLVLAVGVGVFAFAKDRSLPVQGLYSSGRLFGSVWIELLLGFLIAGLLDVLISPSEITAWLGTESSTRGILLGWMAGLVIPGGPYLLFPVVANLWKTGAAPGALIALVTAKTLVSPIRISPMKLRCWVGRLPFFDVCQLSLFLRSWESWDSGYLICS